MFKVQIMLENDIKQLIYTEVTNSEIYYYRKRLISVAILLCFSFFCFKYNLTMRIMSLCSFFFVQIMI